MLMEAYSITELQLRIAMGFAVELPEVPVPDEGEVMH